MAVQSPPYALQASSHGAELFRRAVTAACTGTGVLSFPDLKVTQNTGTDLKCQVAAGQVLVPGTLGSTTGMPPNPNVQTAYAGALANFTSQGIYYGFNDAAITALAFSSANVTNPRIDLVVATVQDAGYAGGTNNWVIQVVTGTAAGSPVAPAIPANSLVLAQVAIAANATAVVNANITDVRPFARLGLSSQTIQPAFVSTSENTTSTTPADLATVGPTVSLIVPASGIVQVTLSAQISPAASNIAVMYVDVSGANTAGATNSACLVATGSLVAGSYTFPLVGLNPGMTQFRAKYASLSGGSTAFAFRRLIVQTFP